MTETKNRFEHDHSPYERPDFPYRCGREAAFGRPCPRGPTAGGACQGMADCAPFQTRKLITDAETGEEREIVRWECRRPAHAGGPCAEGPRPDGACSCVHPPCAPTPTIRRQRGRWALIAVAAVVTLVLALAGVGRVAGMSGLPSSINPGALSGKHAQFTAGKGCVSCHAGHSETLTGWATALFEHKAISESCVTCHAFGADDAANETPGSLVFAAHNTTFPNRTDAPTADCQGCHTEHQGESASITPIVNGQCAGCHTEQFDNFAKSHPKFSANFPHGTPRTIKFPHTKHFSQYFQDARYADNAPQEGCVTCHADQADGRLLPGSFEVGCAGCHEQAIKEQGFALFGLPELSDPKLTADAREACGFAASEVEAARGLIAKLADTVPALDSLSKAMEAADPAAVAAAAGSLEESRASLADGQAELADAIEEDAISLDAMTPAAAYLLGVVADDPDAYSESAAKFLVRAAKEGHAPIAEAIEERGGDAKLLLAGLSPELVTRVTCAWTANAEYEPVDQPRPGAGWTAEEYQVAYLPTGHADAVTRGWIGLALASEGQDVEGAEAFRTTILDPKDGPGRCFKCHVAPDMKAKTTQPVGMKWGIPRDDVRPFTTFDHTPHLNVLAKGAGCATCHRSLGEGEQLADAQKRPGPHPNEFKPIEANICAECHHDGGVRQDCGLCHRYHSDPAIRKRTM